MRKSVLALAIVAITACSESPDSAANKIENATDAQGAQLATDPAAPAKQDNPLLQQSSLQYQAPDFSKIRDEHFQPAFEQGMAEHLQEVQAIAGNPELASFNNTIVAMEKSGSLLTRVSRVFFNLAGTDSNEARRALQSELAPKLAAHWDSIYLNDQLFSRVASLYDQRVALELDPESDRLLEVYYDRFVKAGAKLTAEQKDTLRALNEEHSSLTTQFSQNLLKITKEIAVVVDDKQELDGMSDSAIKSAAAAAAEAGHEGKYLISITNTTRQPVLASLKNRELRQRIWEASANRGTSGELDNRPVVQRLVQIRAQKADLLGYDNWAEYQLTNTMAEKPEAVMNMLSSMVPAVISNTKAEQAAIQAMIEREGGDFEAQPWDWAYYAEKVRQDKYDLNEQEVREYFEFNRVLNDGLFYTMNRLYGIRFEERPDLPVYHPDVQAYELFDHDGKSLAIFYADYFAREGKRGGAWMSSFVGQSGLLEQKPVVVNVMNIPKGPEGEPTLVSYDHVTTMFHELGHGLHGMFSDVRYPSLAGTNTSRDYVEFPSTFEEDWAGLPEVLENYAYHYKTGEPIPAELLEKVQKAKNFNMGFDTLEYMSAALLDMEWHSLPGDAELQDVEKFEAAALKKHGVDLPAVPPRYKSTYFAHSIGGGYSAGYYAYMWSEILAADAFAYIRERGGLTRKNGDWYRKNILETGNSRPPMESYVKFRGQEPTTEALLERRGLNPKG
ncbi:dipeptidyl carboxypeptidase II [Microbulbifer flavimaris]|uniref:Dipeptidyl carboxypeptidase II n=1 Tax=Microbulbifer flavimaris TaxID=1781068 RepID=A0ABX4I4P1_9GAMM|nr:MULTISPECIES: M3 family metallopeptidase [Microbulbifer]KUJ84777.1 dipeptidyl carboxypeptidase [Microbulbifer sp. ZGT114]PCO06872.1 dipeptidyl carboxypeptidase II [Microbulbifer flavimaris]